MVRAVQAQYRGEVYLGWDCGRYSVAVWHQGQWLCASLTGSVADTLRSLAATDAEGITQQRVQRLEETLIQRAGGDPRKRLSGWGRREIDRSYLQEVENKALGVLQGLGVAFADVTVTAEGKLCLSADGTSAESVFYEDCDSAAVLTGPGSGTGAPCSSRTAIRLRRAGAALPVPRSLLAVCVDKKGQCVPHEYGRHAEGSP
jgi:hypothetical protein